MADKLTHADKERMYYVLGMAAGFGAVMPEKMFPMLLAVERMFDVDFAKLTRMTEEQIFPWFDDFLTILRGLSKEEIIEYAEKAAKWIQSHAGGMMFG